MPREQTQDQEQTIRNPGNFSADDDEAQDADVSRATSEDLDLEDEAIENDAQGEGDSGFEPQGAIEPAEEDEDDEDEDLDEDDDIDDEDEESESDDVSPRSP